MIFTTLLALAAAQPAVEMLRCSGLDTQMLKGKGHVSGTYVFDRAVTLSVHGQSTASSDGHGWIAASLKVDGVERSASRDDGGHTLNAQTSTTVVTRANLPITTDLSSNNGGADADADTVRFNCTFPG